MRRYFVTCKVLGLVALATLMRDAQCQAAATASDGSQTVDPIAQICPLVESAARTSALPLDFFVRLIWQESRFRPDVKGPATANGQRAEGIAQFMPATSVEHNLAEPFNPRAALPKSGAFLAQLRDRFGNLGLAAAAYNAGSQRVREYLSGSKSLPAETRNYVLAITGHSVEEWTRAAPPPTNNPIPAQAIAASTEIHAAEPVATCRDVVAHLEQARGHPALQRQAALPVEQQTRRVSFQPPTDRLIRENHVPSWCSGLRHPNVSVCGDVHLRAPATKTAALLAHTEPHRSKSHIHLPRVSLP